ncbi:glycosyltransferase family 4 protein [Candidatus Nomurabacteria bacterium]|nr:glycosyltransferase family 4 protein [Candidatus Nomurabacteria bacterium]
MKICIYAHSFPPIIGGAQTYQYNLAIGLGKLGHEVLVLTGDIPDSLKLKIKDYKSSYFKVVRVPGFRESIKMKAPFRDLLIDSFNILKKFDPDIIYSNGFIPCLLISMIKDSLRAKHIFSYHSTPELDVNKLVGIWPGNLEFELSIAKFIFKQRSFDAYLACSNNYLNTVKNNVDAKIKNAHRIYYGVDMKKFSFEIKVNREKYGFSDSDFIVLCPVRFIERKGILDILKAVSILKKEIPNIKLLIPTSKLSTNDKFAQSILMLIKKLKIENYVSIRADEFGIEDMPKVYALSDIMVFPSYSEGLGIISLESMSMKKPVVATNIAGINEVVIHNKTGMLVNIKSPKQIAESVKLIHDDKNLRDRLIKNAYSITEKEFELNKQVKKVEKLFIEVYGKNK